MKSAGLLVAFAVLAIVGLIDAQDKSAAIGVGQISLQDLEEFRPLPWQYDECCKKAASAAPPGGCYGPGCVIYDLSSQSTCTEITEGPSGNAAWSAGLSLTVDAQQLGGKIAAYKIQWFYGGWSGWYVPGTNDLDWKLNGCGMRRVWSYFSDHNHMYILCK